MSTPPPSEPITNTASTSSEVFSSNSTNEGSVSVGYSNGNQFGKTFLIIILVAMLVLSFLGINILQVMADWIEKIVRFFGPTLRNTLSMFSYSTGDLLDKSSETVASALKTGVDVADGAVEDIGILLMKGSGINESGEPVPPTSLPTTIDMKPTNPEPDKSSNPIQNPISSNKSAWCLVGEDQGKRGCIEIGESDKCMSGQIFPSQKVCLNPTYTVSQYYQ